MFLQNTKSSQSLAQNSNLSYPASPDQFIEFAAAGLLSSAILTWTGKKLIKSSASSNYSLWIKNRNEFAQLTVKSSRSKARAMYKKALGQIDALGAAHGIDRHDIKIHTGANERNLLAKIKDKSSAVSEKIASAKTEQGFNEALAKRQFTFQELKTNIVSFHEPLKFEAKKYVIALKKDSPRNFGLREIASSAVNSAGEVHDVEAILEKQNKAMRANKFYGNSGFMDFKPVNLETAESTQLLAHYIETKRVYNHSLGLLLNEQSQLGRLEKAAEKLAMDGGLFRKLSSNLKRIPGKPLGFRLSAGRGILTVGLALGALTLGYIGFKTLSSKPSTDGPE